MDFTDVNDTTHRAALRKIADRINARERNAILIQQYGASELRAQNARERASGDNAKAHGAAKWRKVADVPPEIHRFFEKQYGKDFWKDKTFWKHHPEWLTVEPWEL
jgi:hypothetical protein